jgi:hypothetical protein
MRYGELGGMVAFVDPAMLDFGTLFDDFDTAKAWC